MMLLNRQTGKQEKIELKKGIDNAILQIFKSQAPVSTGTLKGRIRVETFEDGFRIVSDIYYMTYTTEKWGYNRRWQKVLPNPNEGWWQDAFNIAMRFLSTVYGEGFKRES